MKKIIYFHYVAYGIYSVSNGEIGSFRLINLMSKKLVQSMKPYVRIRVKIYFSIQYGGLRTADIILQTM